MMRNIYSLLIMIPAILVIAGCEKNGQESVLVPLTVSVSDDGFLSSDGAAVYPAEFSDGDAIGLFAVENGTVLEAVDNLRLTASSNGGSIVWSSSDSVMTFPENAVYYAYYPYQENFGASVDPSATTASEFFADFIAGWNLPDDQSNGFADYDLSVGTASPSSGRLDFEMSHAMGLVKISLPEKTYRFTNTDRQIPDYSLSGNVVFNDFKPWTDGNFYIYLIMPGNFSLSGSYGDTPWQQDGEAIADNCVTIDYGEPEVIEHLLQVGDFFLADGSLISKDAPASEVSSADVIGIVCQIDPDRIADGEKEALGGVAHAIVLATRVAGFLSADNLGYMRRFYTDYSIQNTDFEASYTRDEEEIGFPNIPMTSDLQELYTLADENLDGYRATHLIYTERADDFAKGYYPGFKAVYDFASEVGGPAEGVTTGWFMPSGGQYLDAIRNLCNVELDITGIVASGVANGSMAWEGQGALASAMNKAMEKVSNNNKILYSDYQNGVMIAATASDKYYRYIDIADGGWVDYICFFKYATSIVRPMLAF
ncbi:MAG: fimbrillin family protein [Bacteroidetes bacterium]|uniref:Fimbrillin family protein n=1 Tax=Candidatus Merdivivens pullistercoris TaxID=2840873 RepID=A0A9D9I4W2_9BACT|nr:fimbrillin family protein [Candidatus Merdivivens pullistercoris]